MNAKTRSSLLALAAAYLLYLAHGLYQDRADPAATMAPTLRWLFIAVFALAAIAILVYAFLLWRRSEKEEKEKTDWEDENRLK